MVRTARIAVLLALVAAVVLMLWSWDHGEPPMQSPGRGQSGPGLAAPEAAATSVAPSAAGPAADPAAVREASGASDPEVAVDEALPVITVKVVDGTTDRPVAGAEVSFLTEAGDARCAELPWAERSPLYRDPETLARRFGTTVTTDAEGLAAGSPKWDTEITARHGERYGSCQFFAAAETPPGGYRIVLEADRSVVVRVVTADGRPAFDIPIATAVYRTDGTRLRWLRHPGAESVAPDGLAVLRHLQQPLWDEAAPRLAADEELRASIDLPGCDTPSAPFSLAAPPAQPLVLLLPPLGSLSVFRPADFGGFSGSVYSVGLAAADAAAVPRSHDLLLPDGAPARYSQVATGKDYVVKCDTIAEVRCAGPAAAGDHVEVHLKLVSGLFLVVGTAVGPDGRPLASIDLRSEANLNLIGYRRILTGREGRFSVLLSATGSNRLEWLRLSTLAGHELLQGEAGPLALVPGRNDVGKLRLEAPPMLAAGQIHGLSVAALAEQGLVVEQFYAWRDNPPDWYARQGLIARIDDAGTFSLFGKVGVGDLRMHLGEHQPLRQGPVGFAPGERGVRLEAVTLAHVRAGVRLPAECSDEVIGELTLAGGAPSPAGSPFERRSGEREGERAILEWRVSTGVYDLALRARGFPEPLAWIRGVAVGEGQADPRLADIDLRGKVAMLEISVHDAAGAPLDAQVASLSSTNLSTMRRMWVSDGHGQLLVPAGPIDLFVFEYGYRPAELRGVRGKVAVVLQPWEATEFVLDGAPPLPVDCTYVLDADAQPGTVFRNEDPAAWRTPRGDRGDVVDGRVRLAFGSGQATLQLIVQHSPSRREVVVQGLVPERVQHQAEPLVLQVPAASVAAAVRELLAGK